MSFKNLLKSKKGQAFSTFQLLIAAVVALAILALLLPMIINGPDIGTGPSDAINTLLKSAPDDPGVLLKSTEVKFSSKDVPYISASAVVQGTGLSANQVKFKVPHRYDSDFVVLSTDEISALKIKTSESVKYIVGVLCDDDRIALRKSYELYSGNISEDTTLQDIDFVETEFDNSGTACIVYPTKS